MKENNDLPKGWKWKKLGEIGKIMSGGTPSTSISEYWNGNINWISPSDLTGYKKKTIAKGAKSITKSGLQNSSAHLMPKGSVLFSSRAPIGYVVISDEELSTNQGFKSIIPNKDIASDFLYYFLLASKRTVEQAASGTTFKEINLSKFSNLLFPHPPIQVQLAIVSKIEELFSELDKGIENLRIAKEQLKTYRQSVLKWAFFNGKYHTSLLKAVTEKIQIGPFGTQLHKEDYIENGIPLINPMHIKDGNVVADYSFSISKSKRNSLPNYILKEGDVIMGRRGEMGRCGLITKNEAGWFCGTGSLYFRPNLQIINSNFLYYYLRSESVKKYLDNNAGGTTMANLNLKIVSEIPIALPPIKQQESVVQEIETRLSVADKMEESITQSLKQSEALRQSILKKAFEGTLI